MFNLHIKIIYIYILYIIMSSSIVYINQNNELEKINFVDIVTSSNITTLPTSNVIFGNSTKNANFKFNEITFENNININKNTTVSGNLTISNDILPSITHNSNIGSITKKFNNIHAEHIYVGANSLWIGEHNKIEIDNSNNLKFRKINRTKVPLTIYNKLTQTSENNMKSTDRSATAKLLQEINSVRSSNINITNNTLDQVSDDDWIKFLNKNNITLDGGNTVENLYNIDDVEDITSDLTGLNNIVINKNLNVYGNINIKDGLIIPNNSNFNSFNGSIYYNDTNHKFYGYYNNTKEWKILGSDSDSIYLNLNQNLNINGNLTILGSNNKINVESLNIKSPITLNNNTTLTTTELESISNIDGWSQNGFDNKYWTKYYNFNTTSSVVPNINKLLYNEDNCVLEWNRNVSQLQFKANLPVPSTSTSLIYPRYVSQTSVTKNTILKTEEEIHHMIANGLSPGFPFLTHDFQPNHNFSGNMNNSTNDVLFKADGSIIIDSHINNHNSTYPSLYYKYYVNNSKNVSLFLKTTKKPIKN